MNHLDSPLQSNPCLQQVTCTPHSPDGHTGGKILLTCADLVMGSMVTVVGGGGSEASVGCNNGALTCFVLIGGFTFCGRVPLIKCSICRLVYRLGRNRVWSVCAGRSGRRSQTEGLQCEQREEKEADKKEVHLEMVLMTFTKACHLKAQCLTF